MFTTRTAETVSLDAVEAVTIRPLTRPGPADDRTNADDRAQAARELADWTHFPFEVAILCDDGAERILYGTEARDFVRAYVAGMAPWM